MIEVKRIQDWQGREVIDSAGEKLGKLEEVIFLRDSDEAVFARVKHGLLGRHAYMVPLAGATATRDHVRVDWTAEQVGGAPAPEGDLDADGARGLASHYGLEEPDGDVGFETGTTRAAREQEQAEADARARELEEEAAARRAEAKEAEQSHAEASEEAKAARETAERAEREAAEARKAVP